MLDFLKKWLDKKTPTKASPTSTPSRYALEFDLEGETVRVESSSPSAVEKVAEYFTRFKTWREIASTITPDEFLLMVAYWTESKLTILDNPDVFRDTPHFVSLVRKGILRKNADTFWDSWELTEKGRIIMKHVLFSNHPYSVQTDQYHIHWYLAKPDNTHNPMFVDIFPWVFGPLVRRKVWGDSDYVEILARSNLGKSHSPLEWDIIDRLMEDSYTMYPFLEKIHAMHRLDRKIRSILFPEKGYPSREQVNAYRTA